MKRARVTVYGLFAIVAVLLSACSSDSDHSKLARADAGGETGGDGGSGREFDTRPNLSTAGQGGGGAGGSAGSRPECKFLELADCVKQAIEEAVACLAVDRTGTFNEDRTRCTVPEADAEIQFAAPARNTSDGYRLDFDLKVDDVSCVHFAVHDAEPDRLYVEKYELATHGHTVTYWHGFERKLECDGQSYAYTATALMDCPGSNKLELPMPVVTPKVSSLDFEFARSGGFYSKVFTCADP